MRRIFFKMYYVIIYSTDFEKLRTLKIDTPLRLRDGFKEKGGREKRNGEPKIIRIFKSNLNGFTRAFSNHMLETHSSNAQVIYRQ